jgi:hypothetical protein
MMSDALCHKKYPCVCVCAHAYVCVGVVTFTCAEFDVMIHKETEVDYSSVLFSFTISDILLNWSALLLCIHECQVQILAQRPVLLAVV